MKRIVFLPLLLFAGCLIEPQSDPPKDRPEVRILTAGIHPSLSPDGKKMVFSNEGDIFISDTGGNGIYRLTSGKDQDILPQWSPDGSRIGFVRRTTLYSQYGTLMVMRADSTDLSERSTENAVFCPFGDAVPPYSSMDRMSAPEWSWSPNGHMIAFYSGTMAMTTLTVIPSGGGAPLISVVLNRSANGWSQPNHSGFTWVPTGDGIICTSNTYTDSSMLYQLTPETGAMVLLNDQRFTSNPSCSSNGRYLGFQSYHSYRYWLYDAQADTLTSAYLLGTSPKLTPDGSRSVYHHYYQSSNPDGYSTYELRSYSFSTGTISILALAPKDYHFVIDAASSWVYYSRSGMLRKAPIR